MKSILTPKMISEVGVREKYIRKNHYNTLKVWWARRPITAMRNLLIREVINVENPEISTELVSDVNPSTELFKSFSTKYGTSAISVLDVFSGGGSIPFESARLGFKTFSSELNPVASLLQETTFKYFEIPNYSEVLRKSGLNIIERLSDKYEFLYTLENGITPYVFFISKLAKCKKCNEELDLRRLKYLAKKEKKKVIISKSGDLEKKDNEEKFQKEFVCSNCNTSHNYSDIKQYCVKNSLEFKTFAYCYYNEEKKKDYAIFNESDIAGQRDKNIFIDESLDKLKHLIPDVLLSKKGGVINPTLYDLKKPHNFFNKRQLLILLALINEIIEEFKIIKKEYDKNTAKQITLGLTALIEFLVDWNSTGTMWISQNEQTGRSLAGPGVGMKWDFIEINPFFSTGSNLKSKLNRVCNTFKSIDLKNEITIFKGSSHNLNLPDNSIDIILTDPPYFDSIDYTGLSEFFRPWFEVLLRNTFAKNISLENELESEAIVDLANGKNNGKGANHYQKMMTEVLCESSRVLKNNGSILLLYSHKTFEGWKVIAESLNKAGLFIDKCTPIEMERIARPRAMSYEALNGVIVFRIIKSKESISGVNNDLLEIPSKIENGEILESHVVIYLASLACKKLLLEGGSFDTAYSDIIKEYSKSQISRNNDLFDDITLNYLYAYLEKDFDLELLIENGLYNKDKDVLIPFNEIQLNEEGTFLKTAKSIYDDFRLNSKTKIRVSDDLVVMLSNFFSTLSGLYLNTVSKRSSNEIVKVSRLILSKL